jgi:hypothetical protein
MQQGAEHVDRAALEASAADQHFGPVGGLVGAGELPTAPKTGGVGLTLWQGAAPVDRDVDAPE